MTRLPGHKAGCRCVACSPATRARGMRAMRKAPRRRKNPATLQSGSQVAQKARLVLIASEKIGAVPAGSAVALLQLANAVAFGAPEDVKSAAAGVLKDKGLFGKRAMHTALDRAMGLLARVVGHKSKSTKINPTDPLAAQLALLVKETKPAGGHFTLANSGKNVLLVFVDKAGRHAVSPAQSRESLVYWMAAYGAGFRFARKQLR